MRSAVAFSLRSCVESALRNPLLIASQLRTRLKWWSLSTAARGKQAPAPEHGSQLARIYTQFVAHQAFSRYGELPAGVSYAIRQATASSSRPRRVASVLAAIEAKNRVKRSASMEERRASNRRTGVERRRVERRSYSAHHRLALPQSAYERRSELRRREHRRSLATRRTDLATSRH